MADARCLTCAHPDVGLIDRAIARGTSARAVARDFDLGRMSVLRHVQAGHGAPAPLAAVHDATYLLAEDPSTRALAAAELAFEALDRAERLGRLPLILQALRGARAAARSLREDWAGRANPPSDEDRDRHEALYEKAVAFYGRARGTGLELAALEGLRAALGDVRAVTGASPTELVQLVMDRGDGILWPCGMVPVNALTSEQRRSGVIRIQWRPEPDFTLIPSTTERTVS